ncbi:MAG: DUF4440 domain-containing protein [Terriglobales bacterium]
MLKCLPLIAVVAAVCLLSACTMYSKPKKGFAGATGGEQLEKQLWDDIKAKNWKDLEPRLAPGMVSSSPESTRDRAASIEHWKKWDLQSVSVSDVQVQSAGADFIVTAVVTVTGTVGGQPAPSQAVHSMTVWQQVSKGFVVVAHSDPLP